MAERTHPLPATQRAFSFLELRMNEQASGTRPDVRHVLRETVDGRTTVFVPLRDQAGFAAIDAADFDRLTACGLSADWFAASDAWGVVHVQAPSSNARHYPVLRVARLVTGAAPHQRVRRQRGHIAVAKIALPRHLGFYFF